MGNSSGRSKNPSELGEQAGRKYPVSLRWGDIPTPHFENRRGHFFAAIYLRGILCYRKKVPVLPTNNNSRHYQGTPGAVAKTRVLGEQIGRKHPVSLRWGNIPTPHLENRRGESFAAISLRAIYWYRNSSSAYHT